ncbi:MAG: prepilin-type N-terminal cleavage/methylation domain-containing protein [Betaproteobacteria bacterium]|nr:prepilin-type N-terminal cleavage/methylation domain-containing protein [Betaproteobacteria bacterium]
MSRLPVCPALSIQRGMTLIELMISMLLGLIVVGGVLGIFVANSETSRRTADLSRIQENARVSVQFMGRSMREAGGNPCGLPAGAGLILHTTQAPTSNWWSGGDDFTSAFIGFAEGNSFPANGAVTMVADSDALITVSGNTFVKAVIDDDPTTQTMLVPSKEGFADGDILFACSTDKGRGVVFGTGGITASGANWSVARATPFEGAEVKSMPSTALGRINAEGWFVGENAWGGTSLFRAFNGDNGQPEEIAQDVSAMRITYLLPNANQYVAANQISNADWPNVIAAYIELTITRSAGNQTNIERSVGLTVNLRNRSGWSSSSDPNEADPP